MSICCSSLATYHMYKISFDRSSWIELFIVMYIKFMLISHLIVVSAYNIDINFPILYPNSATNANQYQHTRFDRSYFGYSTLLHHDSQTNTSWLFIGAPRGNYTLDPLASKLLNEPGVVYRCSLPGPCVEITPAIIKDEEIYLRKFYLRARIKKKHSWFGGAMAIERVNGFLTICAPRTTMDIITSVNEYIETMQGICYSDQLLSTSLEAEITEIQQFDYSKSHWKDPVHGFSVTFLPLPFQNSTSRIIGRPNDDTTGSIDMTYFLISSTYLPIHRKITESPIHDELSQFGYAVTSGYYFYRTELLYVCGDPGWNYVGQVAIINAHKNYMVTRLHGSDIGEFFGASLATGDLNKDGLHDLIIGAPHWGNDNGRVHIYLGSLKKKFEAATILEGASKDGQFGYAIASGDLDRDGFDDIIVSAPWEESGILYIYNGDASLKEKVRPIISQRITTQSLGYNLLTNGMDIQTFGFSISELIDIDGNGYVDIAVGAYKSGHVMILRSKPVVRKNLTIYTVPSTLQRNVSEFLIKVCVDYHGYDTASIHAFKISLIIDERYKRTKETSLELVSMDIPVQMCVNTNITLSDNIQDFIEPIAIYASHDFIYNDLYRQEFCKICPVETRSGKSKSAQALLPFDIECGEDGVCNSNISVTVKFGGIRENGSWVIGSNEITLETHLENYAEPAYLTSIVFILPDGIVLRSILPSCEENTNEDTLMVICTVGNPLETNEQKMIKLDLDMRGLTDSSLHGQILEFSTEIRTYGINHGTRIIKSLLTLQSEASLLLNGKAIEESYHLLDLSEDQQNITFQHIYQILKFGATSIKEAQLIVNVPTAINNSDSLISLYKPRVYISGEYYDCLSNEIDLTQQNEFQKATVSDESDLYAYNLKDETLQNTTHVLFKRDINNHTIITARILQTLYNGGIIKSEDSNGNLTVRESDTIYLNCSTYGVNCSMVYCNLSALKTQQDIGKLVMRLILNVTKLKDNFELSERTKIVKFSTDAYVQIIQPAYRISGVDTRRIMNLTTEFRTNAKIQKLQLWIMVVSVSLGLILLCIIVVILNMVGFFKRATKEELSALKTNEVTENVNLMEITNTSE